MITHDRWRRIKEIFYSALDHPPADRSTFLNEVCGTDAAMRQEVEALLTADAENEDFLVETAYEFAAGMISDEPREFSPGQEVGQYKIEWFISSGGMGQIYEAHDLKLGRKIALKFISPEYAKDPHRVQRFEQEARAASALNHPNVCVIHDIGVTDHGRHFIAMEFIVGPTLRDELAHRTFRPLEALDIIIQVGDALASAHAKGIVHRDIKPENIMLRPDGYVKVVDFGLAKLTELLPDPQRFGEAETMVHTEPHMIMGTVRYMSPEQLREGPVDERTDIWSLGVVLYEMLTGTMLFKARSPNDSIALILAPQPCELHFTDDIPIKLREIVKETLEKDCAQRYQTVTKLTSDLRGLKRELELTAETDFPPVREFKPSPISDRRKKKAPNTGSQILTRLKSQAILTADTLFTEIRSHKRAAIFAGATFILALLVFLPVATSWINKVIKPSPGQWKITRLTQDGKAICSAISPDDKFVAYAEEQNGKQRLVVTNTLNSGSSVAIPPEDVQYLGITFSRDNYLYFTRTEKDIGVLYRLAWPGNNPIKLKEGVDSPISLSPNGDRFAFVRYNETKTEFFLILSDIDGTNEQIIASRKNGATLSLYGAAWSPDGNTIVCPAGDRGKGWHMNLIAFDLRDRSEQLIGNRSWFSIQQVAWQQDIGLIISATRHLTSPHHLWQISFPDGEAQEITTDTFEYTNVSISDKRIVTLNTHRTWRIWVAPLNNIQAMNEIVRGTNLNYGLAWSSHGIVYSSMTQDGLNIYRINPDGSNKVQLTAAAGDNYMPALSPDGSIVFASNRSGSSNIWRMNADGSDPRRLTYGDEDYYPSCSPDNEWVAYDNLTEWKASVWKVPLAGGEAIKVGENYRMPAFSPDGQLIACRYDKVSGSRNVAIFPAQGGEPLQHFEVPRQEWQSVQWLQNSQELSYVWNAAGYSNLWTYDRKTGTSKQLTNFNSEQIYAYAWSPDFKQIAFLRGTKMNNVTMISSSER